MLVFQGALCYTNQTWLQETLTQALYRVHFVGGERSRRGHKGQLPYTSSKVHQYGYQNVANSKRIYACCIYFFIRPSVFLQYAN